MEWREEEKKLMSATNMPHTPLIMKLYSLVFTENSGGMSVVT